jgi:Zn-dependent peptidase ImmA (M78 family)/DNA-binding XRE family transcriptional regulator
MEVGMIGERIQQARKSAGLSLRALAEMAGVSAMAISKYENNKSTPSSKVLLDLARALDVRVEYFFRTAKVELKGVEYRKHSKLPKKVLSQIEGDVIEQIERYLELEEFLPTNPIESFKLPAGLPEQISDYDEIENVAGRFRHVWGLGDNPIPDLIDTLEEKGIKVFQTLALHEEKFDGLAAQVNGAPVIVVGKDWPGDRQRFTLAHELGHLALTGRTEDHLDIEIAANRFAGAFLAPAAEVLKELGNQRKQLEPVELCVLKKAYGLSMQGWLYRARDLGVLSQASFQNMWKLFIVKGWKKKEPIEYPSEKPKLFMQLVFHACAEELIGESKAAELLGKSLAEFRRIRNAGSCETQAAHQ